MKVTDVNIRPMKIKSGLFVLYEVTIYDEPIPGVYKGLKTRTIVWPPSKQPNGRGKTFPTRKDAIAFARYNMPKNAKYGPRTVTMLSGESDGD